jgi:hypothetical protein
MIMNFFCKHSDSAQITKRTAVIVTYEPETFEIPGGLYRIAFSQQGIHYSIGRREPEQIFMAEVKPQPNR